MPPARGLAQESDATKIEQQITNLTARSFRTRQQATRELIKAGKPALGPLLKRVRSGPLELAVRAMSVFETAYTGKDDAAADAADAALEELAEFRRQDIAEHARQVLDRHRSLRTHRAVRQLEKLNARVLDYRPNAREEPQVQRLGGPRPLAPSVILDDEFRGGADGMKYARRLAGTNFQIYLIDGLKVPEKAKLELESAFDGPTVVRRGAAMLGISASAGVGGCIVGSVVPGTAAARAGIDEGDVITAFDGEPVHDFGELVAMLRTKKPGQEVTLSILSPNPSDDGPTTEKKFILEKWRPRRAAARP